MQLPAKAAPISQQVGKSVSVERRQEIITSLAEYAGQHTCARYHALVLSSAKTFGRTQRPFGVSNDIADTDFSRRARQRDTAAFATVALDKAAAGQTMNYLNQVVSRDMVALRDVRDVRASFATHSQVRQHAQRIIRIKREFHGRRVSSRN
jgi:hypothetical protein